MRSVVSTIGTVFYGTSDYLVKLLQPTLAKNHVRLENSSKFVAEACTWNISATEVQVSYDVVALYPSVPIARAINVITDMINADFDDIKSRTKLKLNDIHKLIKLCLCKCYFLWNDKLYEVLDTGPIGLALMVIIAESFLQYLEQNALQQSLNSNICPLSYRRYVDDGHARFETISQAQDFLSILNSQDNHIQYTMETEGVPGHLDFLDITIINSGKGSYEFKIHRKEAITNIQIKPNSSVDPQIHIGVFKGFIARAYRICSPKYLEEELNFITTVFVENGYKREHLQQIIDKYHHQATDKSDHSGNITAKIPWIPKLTPRLRRILRKQGVKVITTSGPNLTRILCNNKSKLPANSFPGIYEVNCGCGATYVGETKKRVKSRLSEHEKNIFNGKWKESGATQHARDCDKNFNWDEAQTLFRESVWSKRKVREALEIRKAQRMGKKVLNRDDGNIKTRRWDSLLGKLPK